MKLLVALSLALGVVAPWMPRAQRESNAQLLAEELGKRGLPPMLGIAIGDNESHWHCSVHDGEGLEESIGIGQVKVKAIAACRKELGSPECQAGRAELFTSAGNIRWMAVILAANRKLYGSRPEHYLAGYEGYAHGRPHRLTWHVIQKWHELDRAVSGRLRTRRRAP